MILRAARRLTATLVLASACGDSGDTPTTATTTTPADTGTTTSPTPTSSTAPTAETTAADPQTGSTTTAETTAAGESTGAPADVCDLPPLTTSALVFDGTGGVAMGLAPDLGLQDFTLETWVRRDGEGVLSGTGVGGLKLVPLISKGRGETDGSDVDCNYVFGFFGDVLGADFEDMDGGGNHPVHGRTPIPYGSWHHVAATYDGGTWRLYVDGVLDVEQVEGATPRHDSIQHFGLGRTYDSMGDPAGGLHGALDEVRVYSRALGAAEIQATMFSTAPDPVGLVAHWRLDAADGDAVAPDAIGNAPGTISGPTFQTPGAVLDRGAAPVLADPRSEPAPRGARTLLVDVADLEGDPLTVEFFARPLTPADDFTLVALPDTQYYTRNADPPDRPEPDDTSYFTAQTQWTLDHRVERNIVGLLGLGDIINNSDVDAQWQRASAAYAILEDAPDLQPHGFPYAISFGNHDQLPKDEPEATSVANDYFGVDRYADTPWYGGNFDGDNDENFVSFRAGGLEILVISFQFNPQPSPEVLAWARSILLSRPRALGIIATHYIVTGGGNFSSQGEAIYEALKDVPNLQIMASGHVAQDARKTDEYAGNVIHSMLSDYQRSAPDPANSEKPIVVDQGQTNGGLGYMRIWQFMPSRQQLFVESYSPKLDAAYTDDNNEFVLPVDLAGAGTGPFTSLGVVPVEAGTARVTLPDVAPGAAFEWYAVARDCAHAVDLPLQLLTNLEDAP